MTGRIIFSDIDGTIVHYDAEVPPAADAELLVMPRSSTGKQVSI